ncbi:twin-arginine translocation signal domain-containing protein [soil metagenome]
MSPEDRLAAFLSQDDVPARHASASMAGDALFVAEVMQRVARRELTVKLVSAAVTALAAGAVLWACSPVLDIAVRTLAPALTPTAGILTLVAAASLLGGQMLTRR